MSVRTRDRRALDRRAERIVAGTAESTPEEAWWALGDAPVRTAEALVPLVDGRAAMLAMCAAFLSAKHSIWLADWDMHARLQMVRGRDARAGKDGSAEQEALVGRLRSIGLDDDAIALWTVGRARVMDVLGHAARRGVDVHVLLWNPFNPFGRMHIINDPRENRKLLEERGVHVRLDKASRSIFHVAQALHQKCAVVDGHIAFAGGVDLTVEYGGDFDRWDMSSHPFAAAVRATDLGPAPHPWHDVHTFLMGEPAQDVERNIRQRWDETARPWYRRFTPPLKSLLLDRGAGDRDGDQHVREAEQNIQPEGAGPPVPGPAARVQVVRTIPALTYRFAPQGIHGIAQAYLLALRQAREFVYLESQYLWLEEFHGLDIWRLGWPSHFMRAFLDEMVVALKRGVRVAMVLPDHPNAGRAFTDGTIAWLREQAKDAVDDGRLRFYTLAASATRTRDGLIRYRPIYVHAKVGIVDDRWATVGSANLNSRGLSHDAELNVSVLDDDFARALRLALWAEHCGALSGAHTGWPAPAALPLPNPLEKPRLDGLLHLLEPVAVAESPAIDRSASAVSSELTTLHDPKSGLDLLERRARENLDRLSNEQPLVGQILPYLCHYEGEAHGVDVSHESGMLDPLRSKREGVTIRHPKRYM